MSSSLKCKWRDSGHGSWHTTLDSDVSGVYVTLDLEHKDFAVMLVVPSPDDNKRIAGYKDLISAKKAAKEYYIAQIEPKVD